MTAPTLLASVVDQRAFSPDEVAKMLNIGRRTIFTLLKEGELGSTKVKGSRRIFLSDLEDLVGEERAHSLVRELNRGESKGDESGEGGEAEDAEE